MGKFGEGREAYNISEAQIREAIKHTLSNREAADYLNVNINTFRKYASQYVDPETGKTLYELHKNMAGKGIAKSIRNIRARVYRRYEGILDGRNKGYKVKDKRQFTLTLFKYGLLEPRCRFCGFSKKRALDHKYPILMEFEDNDPSNLKRENLLLLCFNCYFLHIGNLNGSDTKALQDYIEVDLRNL